MSKGNLRKPAPLFRWLPRVATKPIRQGGQNKPCRSDHKSSHLESAPLRLAPRSWGWLFWRYLFLGVAKRIPKREPAFSWEIFFFFFFLRGLVNIHLTVAHMPLEATASSARSHFGRAGGLVPNRHSFPPALTWWFPAFLGFRVQPPKHSV